MESKVWNYGSITVLYQYDEKYGSALNDVMKSHDECIFLEDDDFKDQIFTFLKNRFAVF